MANSSNNNDIQKALREALAAGLGDFLLQEPTSSQNGSGNTNNSTNNQQTRSGKPGNKQSKGTQNNNGNSQSQGAQNASESRGNSLLNLFRQRLIQRLSGENLGRSGRAGSRKARRS